MAEFDIVFLGAGQNCLITAAYLAKAGKKVLLLERLPHYGGGVTTLELMTPGYWNDQHSTLHVGIQGSPIITEDELGLQSKFGLKYLKPDLPAASIWEDGTTLRCWRDLDKSCEEIAKFSNKDAETYHQFVSNTKTMMPMMNAGLSGPPLPVGAFVSMMDQSEEGRYLLYAMQSTPEAIIDELFEDELVKLHILRMVSESLVPPDYLGGGHIAMILPGMLHTQGLGSPEGGSGMLAKSLVRCIEHYGGEVRCNAEVSRVIVSSGQAKGLELTTGETFMAKDAVVANIHPHVLSKFVEGISEPLKASAKRVTQGHISVNMSHMNLKKRACLKVGEEFNAPMAETMDFYSVRDMNLEFDKLKRGMVSPSLVLGNDSCNVDPSRAPEGAGVFYGVNFAPYELHDGGAAAWDDKKEEYADLALRQWRKFYDGLDDDNIIARQVDSPLDQERFSPNSYIRGDIHGAAQTFAQSSGHRPTPQLGNFQVPDVESLYLVGPFMHPGGGILGSGRAAAIKIMEDFDIDSGQVASATVV